MASKKSPDAIPQRLQSHRLRSFSVCGYKSIGTDQSLELRPLTVLAGANSAGKSSMFQPLLLLKQTLDSPFDPGALLLDGANVRLTSADQLLSRSEQGPRAGFSLALTLEDGFSLRIRFAHVPREGMSIQEMTFSPSGKEAEVTSSIRPGMTSNEIEQQFPSLKDWKKIVPNQSTQTWRVIRDRCFLGLELISDGRALPLPSLMPIGIFNSLIESIIHVPGLRGNPNRTYSATAVGNTFPGTFENYVASVINHWRITNDKNLRELGQDLATLGLTWKVEARPKDDTQVEILVGRLAHAARGGARDTVSIADVGFGVSQTLPVLVALRTAAPGQLVYLEQPEIHLHPRAQRRMAQILASAAKRGVIVVVETHSALLLRGIQTLVARQELDPSVVKVHWFKRDEYTGGTTISSADLDTQGAYGEDWPEDFDEVALQSEQEYLDASEARESLR